MRKAAFPLGLEATWHPTKNSVPNGHLANPTRNEKVWWRCEKGHEWEASIKNRLLGSNCPFCTGRKVIPGKTDLATVNPTLASQWHSTKNSAKAEESSVGSHQKVWWVCARKHEWEATVASRSRGNGCPYCAGTFVWTGFNDLSTTHPDLASQWHPTKNLSSSPEHVSYSNKTKVWWVCEEGHEWETTVVSRTRNQSGCLVCSNKHILVGYNDLFTLMPGLAAEWHPTKNSNLTPKMVSVGSSRKVWWQCEIGHEWEAAIQPRSKGSGCPYCAGVFVYGGFNDLATLFPHIAAQWHPTKNKPILPSQVVGRSSKGYWWLGECGHEWKTKVSHRAEGSSCPTCIRVRKPLFEQSVASDARLLKEWHPTKNTMLPSEVFKRSGKTIWWQCEKGHEWEAQPDGRSTTNCPSCTSSTSSSEDQISSWLSEQGLTVRNSVRKLLPNPQWEVDIYIPEKKVAIEFNGLYWHSEKSKKSRTYHYDKWLACKELGIQLIQIWEDDWSRNPDLVKRMLSHKLGFSSAPKLYARKLIVSSATASEAQVFLSENHIQGYASGSYYVALRNDDAIVSMIVLRKEAGGVFNIIRYATSAQVQGGFTKLLKYAERTYQPSKFVTFSDNCVSGGGLYEKNGFVATKELPPDYMYVVKNERKHKFGYRLKRFKNDPTLLWEEGLTERELALLNNLPRIWDAGKTKWEKAVNG